MKFKFESAPQNPSEDNSQETEKAARVMEPIPTEELDAMRQKEIDSKMLAEKIQESFQKEGLSDEEIDEQVTRMLMGYVQVVEGLPVVVEPTEEELRAKEERIKKYGFGQLTNRPFPPDFTDAMYEALDRIERNLDKKKGREDGEVANPEAPENA